MTDAPAPQAVSSANAPWVAFYQAVLAAHPPSGKVIAPPPEIVTPYKEESPT
jgi:hypothetical protein